MDITKSCRDISKLNQLAITACNLFMEECKKANLNVIITETIRTKERQMYLYCQGRTVAQCTSVGISSSFANTYCNPKVTQVTWTLNSNHIDGYAWDICNNVVGDEYNITVLNKAGEIATRLGIEWGGTWKQKDTPHFQIDKAWSNPVKSKNWKEVATEEFCNRNGLDTDLWMSKVNDNMTIGELFGILNKVVK